MYCSKCGNQLNDSDKFCPKCGKAYTEQQNTQPDTSNGNTFDSQSEYNNIYNNIHNNYEHESQTTNTNTIALAAIICSIVGLLIYGLFMGIIAIILGVIAYQQPAISSKNKQTAVTAIILGIVDIVGALMFTNMLFL